MAKSQGKPAAKEFYNPYHFVPIKSRATRGMRRTQLSDNRDTNSAFSHVTHARYVSRTIVEHNGRQQQEPVYSGRIVCQLETLAPTLVGADQTESREGRAGVVHQFRLPDGSPAIPSTSLRGLTSSIAEAASNSALRVLHDTPLSCRVPLDEYNDCLGMLVEREVGGRRQLRLLPLTLPNLNLNGHKAEVPSVYRKFPQVLKVYLGNYDRVGQTSLDVNGQKFQKRNLKSYSADHRDQIWHLKQQGSVKQVDGGLEISNVSHFHARGSALLAQRYQGRLSTEPTAGSVPGILRVLGIFDRETEIPKGKKHEIFIPFPDGTQIPQSGADPSTLIETIYDPYPTLDAGDALRRFEKVAEARTADDPDHPFETLGSRRNDGSDRHAADPVKRRRIQLRPGDLVFFKLDDAGNVARLAISSIWRKWLSTTYEYFQRVDPELLPMTSRRETISIAEQIFGFVEDDSRLAGRSDGKRTNSQSDRAPPALAGRIEFSHATLGYQHANYDHCFMNRAEPMLMKILGAPKTPAPVMYFQADEEAKTAWIKKTTLNPEAHRPKGRKWYLHHAAQRPLFKSNNQGKSPEERKRLKMQHRGEILSDGQRFFFHIDFHNLSRTELALLYYALAPSDGFMHKIGMGKPLGLGKVKLSVLGTCFINRTQRYRELNPFNAPRYHEADGNLERWIAAFDDYGDEKLAAIGVTPRALYEQERQALAQRADGESCPAIAELRAAAVDEGIVDGTIHEAIVKLGEQSFETVHYPQVENGDLEDKLYDWFVANDDRNQDMKARQWLHPISEGIQPLKRNRKPEGKSRHSSSGAKGSGRFRGGHNRRR